MCNYNKLRDTQYNKVQSRTTFDPVRHCIRFHHVNLATFHQLDFLKTHFFALVPRPVEERSYTGR